MWRTTWLNAFMKKAIFFDRDNTLIIDSHYMYKLEDLKFYPETFSTLSKLKERGYVFFIVSNQSGLGRKLFTREQLDIFHAKMLEDFAEQGIEFIEVAFCPHHPDEKCDCRKPKPKIVLELIDKYDIDKTRSYFVGDRESDYKCGINAGLHSIKIKDGHELPTLLDLVD